MSKVANGKAHCKKDDNQRSFVKDRGSFHPPEGNLKEHAYLRGLTSEIEPEQEQNNYTNLHQKAEPSSVSEARVTSESPIADKIKDRMELVFYGGIGYLMKAVNYVLPEEKNATK